LKRNNGELAKKIDYIRTMASLSDPENEKCLDTLEELFNRNFRNLSSTDFRFKWDLVKTFDSTSQNHIDSLNNLIRSDVSAGIEKRQLHEVANFMREQGARFNFLNGNQLKIWIENCILVMGLCDTDHKWRYRHGGEWGHESINSICGNAALAGLLPLIFAQKDDTNILSELFLSSLSHYLGDSIEENSKSHAESIIAAVSRNTLWIYRLDSVWCKRELLSQLSTPDRQKAHAYWQGFLLLRSWDMKFLASTLFFDEVISLLKYFREVNTDYEKYFGDDLSRAFAFLLAELYLRTPKQEQLLDFFEEFIDLELNSNLFLEWLDSIAFAIQRIDSQKDPELADSIYDDRITNLVSILEKKAISKRTVGCLAELAVAFRSKFEEYVTRIEKLVASHKCTFGNNSRILIWLGDSMSGDFLAERSPDAFCRLIVLYVNNSKMDNIFADFQLADIVSKYGIILRSRAGDSFRELMKSSGRRGFLETHHRIEQSFGGNNAS